MKIQQINPSTVIVEEEGFFKCLFSYERLVAMLLYDRNYIINKSTWKFSNTTQKNIYLVFPELSRIDIDNLQIGFQSVEDDEEMQEALSLHLYEEK